MSALTDYFSSLANKIRSKVGGVQTYTPLQMVSAIDDVYDAGAASVPAPTSITPSNSSPVTLTANTAVKPTSGGLAIQSLIDIVPDSAGQPLSNGGIYKMLGSAYVYDSQQTGAVPKAEFGLQYGRPSQMSVKGINTLYIRRVLWNSSSEGHINVTGTTVDFDENDVTVTLDNLGSYTAITTLSANDKSSFPKTYEIDVSNYTAVGFGVASTNMLGRIICTGK